MTKTRFAKQVMAGAGLFFLSAGPGLIRAQSLPSAPAQAPDKTASPARPSRELSPMGDFAGLQFTDDQKAKISQIHEDIKARTDAVVKDEKLSPEQKDAMLQGYQRMERSEVYKVLTPEQQAEVRKRVLARRAAERPENQKKQEQPK